MRKKAFYQLTYIGPPGGMRPKWWAEEEEEWQEDPKGPWSNYREVGSDGRLAWKLFYKMGAYARLEKWVRHKKGNTLYFWELIPKGT